jgi:hypothetical protein
MDVKNAHGAWMMTCALAIAGAGMRADIARAQDSEMLPAIVV